MAAAINPPAAIHLTPPYNECHPSTIYAGFSIPVYLAYLTWIGIVGTRRGESPLPALVTVMQTYNFRDNIVNIFFMVSQQN